MQPAGALMRDEQMEVEEEEEEEEEEDDDWLPVNAKVLAKVARAAVGGNAPGRPGAALKTLSAAAHAAAREAISAESDPNAARTPRRSRSRISTSSLPTLEEADEVDTETSDWGWPSNATRFGGNLNRSGGPPAAAAPGPGPVPGTGMPGFEGPGLPVNATGSRGGAATGTGRGHGRSIPATPSTSGEQTLPMLTSSQAPQPPAAAPGRFGLPLAPSSGGGASTSASMMAALTRLHQTSRRTEVDNDDFDYAPASAGNSVDGSLSDSLSPGGSLGGGSGRGSGSSRSGSFGSYGGRSNSVERSLQRLSLSGPGSGPGLAGTPYAWSMSEALDDEMEEKG